MAANADDTAGGTFVPHSFVKRTKDAKVWIGIMPGIIGTVTPTQWLTWKPYP